MIEARVRQEASVIVPPATFFTSEEAKPVSLVEVEYTPVYEITEVGR